MRIDLLRVLVYAAFLIVDVFLLVLFGAILAYGLGLLR